MRVAVTGASGFVGSHLCDELLASGHSVVALDRAPPRRSVNAGPRGDIVFQEGDIRDPAYVSEAIAGCELVFHLAAIVGVSNYMSNPFDVLDVNIIGTRNVLESTSRAQVRTVITSTSEVFGKNPQVPWDEDADRVLGSTRVDRWSYSTSKAAGEHLALAVHRQRGLEVSVVRYFNAFGPRQAPNYVVPRAIHRVLNGRAPVIYDEGTQTRCFTYIDDIVAGTILAGTAKAAVGEVFNLGSSTETSVAEVTSQIIALAGANIEAVKISTNREYGDAYQDIDRRIPDSTKAERLLGWRAKTTLPEGLEATIDWARAHPDWLALPDPILESAETTTDSSS